MRIIFLLLSFVVLRLTAQVSPVAFSKSTDVVPAIDKSGAITLTAARLKIDLAYPKGKKERPELTVLYQPKSGYYLWHITPHNPNNPDDTGLYLEGLKKRRSVVFADAESLSDFIFAGTIFVKVWRGQAASLDAAVSASIDEIQQGLPIAEGLGQHTDYKFVPVFGLLMGVEAKIPAGVKPFPEGFVCEPNVSSFCPTYNNTIASVTRQAGNWRLVLRNRFDVEVILDQDFELVSIVQLTQPKQGGPPK